MVEKLNQTRMSAISANSGRQNEAKTANQISPFKPEGQQKREFATVAKNSSNQRGAFDQDDLNDRADFDKSIKIVGSSAAKVRQGTPDSAKNQQRKSVADQALNKASNLQAKQSAAGSSFKGGERSAALSQSSNQ